MEWIGYAGVAAFALAWIPQSIETIKTERRDVNMSFLLLAAIGSFSLIAYACIQRDSVFAAVNALTTVGALVNIYYKVFPQKQNIG